MKVTENRLSRETNISASSAAQSKDQTAKHNKEEAISKEALAKTSDPDLDTLKKSVSDASQDSNHKIKSSAPENSVGQLAAELARAETKIDVQQVLGKATRALASLKMSAYACEGEDAKKALQMVKRMEKLIKKIQKKLKNLSKEEELENRQKKAEKQNEMQKAKQLQEELKNRRKRRHREEREYALKEMGEDQKVAMNEMLSSMPGASTSDLASVYSSTGIDLSSVGASLDITI